MKSKAERGVISERQLLFILFTVRLYSLLLDVSSMADLALLFALSLALCYAAPFFKNPNKTVLFVLGLISVGLMLQTVLSYLLFIKNAVHPEFSQALLLILVISSVIYAASLKIEALARFSVMCGAVLVSALLIAVMSNLKAFDLEFLNAVSFEIKGKPYNYVKCLDLPVIFALLSSRVNENKSIALFESTALSYSVSLFVMLFFFGVMGTAANVYKYPVFSLFQLSKIGALTRLDIVFTGSALLALFLKCSVLLYCGLYGITGGKYEKS